VKALVAIAGHHRGGTSATAGAVRRMGVYFGQENELMPAAPENPKGFTEHLELVAIHDQLLNGLRLTWDSHSPLPARWRRGFPYRRALERLVGLVTDLAESVDEDQAIGVKDPRMARLAPLWVDVAKQAGVKLAPLVVMRDPRAVGDSLVARNRWERNRAWQFVSTQEGGLHEWLEVPGARRVRFPDLLEWRTKLWPAVCPVLAGHALYAGDAMALVEEAVDAFLEVGLVHHG